MSARVSIIMGIYNCAKTLPEAIGSILSQTFSDWKLIMCDDGSVDNTYEIAECFVKQFPEKMILIQNAENKGLNHTLNRCLEYADTEYIARMDGDDISLPERLEKEVQFLDEHHEYSIVSCPMIYFDDYGDFMSGKGNGEPSISSFCKGTPFCHAPSMVRREAYEAVNGYSESTNRLRVEDWDLWIRMYEKGYKGYNLEELLYKMRDDRNACSRRKFKYRINEMKVSASVVKKLRLSPFYYVFSLRPIIVGFLPDGIYGYLHAKMRMKK